jgi:hypothetical protein
LHEPSGIVEGITANNYSVSRVGTKRLKNLEQTNDSEDEDQELEGSIAGRDDDHDLDQLFEGNNSYEEDENNPFWETQPLLEMEEIPSSQSPVLLRLSQSISSSPRLSTLRSGGERLILSHGSLHTPTGPDPSSPSNRSIDRTPVQGSYRRTLRRQSLTPKTTSIQKKNSTRNDATSENKSLKLTQSDVVASVLVQDSDSAPGSEVEESANGNDADITMVELPPKIKKQTNLSELTQGMEQLSPFKISKRGATPFLQESLTGQGNRNSTAKSSDKESESLVQWKLELRHLGINSKDDPYSPSKFESQLPEEESLQPMSLPDNWQDFRTPTKSLRSRTFHISNTGSSTHKTPNSMLQITRTRTQESPLLGPGVVETPGGSMNEEYGEDNAFGSDTTPGPLARTTSKDWPDIVRRFEDQPSPFPGMFSGSPGTEDGDD